MEGTRISRRSFVKAAAAATAAVAASGFASSLAPVDPAKADEAEEEQIVCSSCRACISNCGVLVHVKNGRVVKIEGDERDPMSKGRVCAKGLAAIQALYNPNRMKYPFKRAGERGENKWERISWKEAIDTIADNLMEIYEKDPMKLVISTGGGGNPQFFGLHRFLQAFGGGNFFEPGCAQCYLPRMCTQPMLNGCNDTSISDSTVGEIYYEDATPACLVMWGADPSQSHVTSGGRAVNALRMKGMKTVVVDPRFTPDAAKADVWLPIRPGTDVAMMNGWIKYIIDNDLYDHEFVMKWTNLPYLINEDTMLLYHADELGIGSHDEYVVWDKKTNAPAPLPYPWNDDLDVELDGEFEVDGKKSRTAFRALVENVAEWTLEYTAEITWCEAEDIKKAIDIYVEGSPHSGIGIGVATDQYEQAAQAPEGVTIIESLMGNYCHQGNTIQSRKNQSLGTYFLFPFNLFGPSPFTPTEECVNRRLGVIEHKGLNYWMASHIPTIMKAVATGEPYQPEMWIDRSGNKLAMVGNSPTFLEAMKNMKFIVHMYMYPTTTSVELADIILPTAEWLETAYGADRCNYWFIRRDVVHTYEHVDETLIWSWFVEALAKRGHKLAEMSFDPANCGPAGAYWHNYDEYKAYLAAFMGNSFGEQWTWEDACEKLPAPFTTMQDWIESSWDSYLAPGEDGLPAGFATTSRKAEPYGEAMTIMGRTGGPSGSSFWDGYVLPPASVDYLPLPKYVEPAESPLTDEAHPYVITEGRVPMYHHGTLRNVPWMRELYPVPRTWINPETAAEIGVEDGDWCYIENDRGTIQGQVLVTKAVAPKVIYQERFWNPELLDSDDPSRAWKVMNINVITKNDAPYNPEYGTYTLRGFTVNIRKAEGAPEGVWTEPEQFAAWLPEVTDETGGGYAVYVA
ncbi:MAG: molybdopterin-dependent oxidoreductase [Coriobacteriales bacterium]|nr:molybdopterin-dependent oxidoreductase [Coriobacteriales bacterium]